MLGNSGSQPVIIRYHGVWFGGGNRTVIFPPFLVFREGTFYYSKCVRECDSLLENWLQSWRNFLVENGFVTFKWVCDRRECDTRSVGALCLKCGISVVITFHNYEYEYQCIGANVCRRAESVADGEGGALKCKRWVAELRGKKESCERKKQPINPYGLDVAGRARI